MPGAFVKSLIVGVTALLAVALAGCPSVYGSAGAPTAATQPSPASAPTPDDSEGDVPLKVVKHPERSPTPTEMASGAQELTERMTRMLSRIEQRHGTTQTDTDPARRDCLAERLLQARGLVAAAESARARLERAVTKNQLTAVQEEYSAVGVAFLKTRLLAEESRRCLVDPPRIGHTETTVTVQPLKRGDPRATEPDPPPAPRH